MNLKQKQKQNQKQTSSSCSVPVLVVKQTTRTGTESQKWRSPGGLSIGEWEEERGRKGTENK